MRLTWRDFVTTLLMAAVVMVYAANAAGWAWPIVDTVRGATLVVGVIGLGSCIVGGSASAIAAKGRYMALMGTLGGVAALLTVVGLVSGWAIALNLLVLDTLLLYAIATVRHMVGESRLPEPA